MSKLDLFFKMQEKNKRFFHKTMYVLWLSFLLVQKPYCQSGWSYEAVGLAGNIIKHTPKITLQTNRPTVGAEVALRIQTNGARAWQVRHHYPQFGVTLSAIHLGNTKEIGYSFGIFPQIMLPIVRMRNWGIEAQVGSGVTYITRPYNRLTNPVNNALGSHWNNLSSFRVGSYFRFNPHWSTVFGVAFSHASNGRSQMPNFGINIGSLYAGLKYTPRPIDKKDFIKTPDTIKPGIVLGFQTAIAHNEDNRIIGGPKYPIYILSGAVGWRFNVANKVWLGYEYEQNKGIYDFVVHTFTTTSHSEAQKLASRNIVFVADEFMFGNVGIWLQTGFYVGKNQVLVPGKYFFKLSTRYYLPKWKNFPSTFGAVTLKTHLFDAEYISWGLGMSW